MLAVVLISSCTNKKQHFIDDLTAGINEGNKELLTKTFPDAETMKLDFDKSTITINSEAVVAENESEITVPSDIKLKDGKSIKVEFTATESEEGYVVSNTKGFIDIAPNKEWIDIAKKTGAIKAGDTEKQLFLFLNDEANVTKLQSILDGLKSKILSVSYKKTGAKEQRGTCMMDFWGTEFFSLTITNNSQYTFENVTATITRPCEVRGFPDYQTTTVKFAKVEPGENTGKFEFGSGFYYIPGKIRTPVLTGITDEDYDKAVKLYNFEGTEFANVK